MRYRKLGRTGMIVSEICFGTMTFGGDGFWKVVGQQDQKAANELVKAAFDGGVNFFDTANVYSFGTSETILGQAIRDVGLNRDDVVVATKVFGQMGDKPLQSGLSRQHIMAQVDASLKRLQLDHIDLYQIHGRDVATPIEETLETLNDLVRVGKVRYIGFCNLPAWYAAKALGVSERRGFARFESAQMYYSIAGRDIEREIVPLAVEEKLAILPWSPLAGGFLSGKFSKDAAGPNDARRTVFDFPPVDKDRGFACIDAMRPIAKAHDCSVARIALAWLLHRSPVTSVIIGAKTVEQLADNLAAKDVKLSADEVKALDEVSKLPREYPGWMLERQAADRGKYV
jgi:aryl-alcohol dehydrogenase-like predicted oxidoreductase